MAQLVLTLAGGVLGGTVAGGLGQSLGALFGAYLGGILDRELVGPQEDRRSVEGARIAEFNLSGSAYGQTIPVIFGRMRVPANIIWVRGIREVVRTETETVGSGGGGKGSGLGGGGGGGAQTVTLTTYHYYADVALAVCEGPITSVYRVWLSRRACYPRRFSRPRGYARSRHRRDGRRAQPHRIHRAHHRQPDPEEEPVHGDERDRTYSACCERAAAAARVATGGAGPGAESRTGSPADANACTGISG